MNRQTIQSALVLEAVNRLKNHATADEVYAAILPKHPNISKGTVYRNLNRLSETGKIRKIVVPDGPDRFDHRCVRHYHAKCVKCGRVFDVDLEYIAGLETQIKDPHGFEFTGHDIFFNGVCRDCQNRGDAGSSPQ